MNNLSAASQAAPSNLQRTWTAFWENHLSADFPLPGGLIDNVRGLAIASKRILERLAQAGDDSANARFEKQLAETQPDGARYQSKAEIREELLVERTALKVAGRRHSKHMFLEVRPFLRELLPFASEHLEGEEAADKEQCEEFGIPYHASAYVIGCRGAIAALDRVLSKLEGVTADDSYPLHLNPGSLLPFIREFHDTERKPDAHVLRMAAKPKPEEQGPIDISKLSPEERAKRAADITALKIKLRADGKL